MNRKRFTRGNGRLDAQTLNAMMDAAVSHEEAPEAFSATSFNGPYLGVIQSSTVITADQKWSYDINFYAPQYFEDTVAVKDLADGDTSSTCWQDMGMGTDGDAVALNLSELNNSATDIMGIDPTNIPAGFALQPVPNGTFVWCWTAYTPWEDGVTKPGASGFLVLFEFTNQLDGTC